MCSLLLRENIDLIFPNKLHGPMHYIIGVTCRFNQHKIFTCCTCNNTIQSNPPISQFNSLCNKFTSVWSMFPCNTQQESTVLYQVTKSNVFVILTTILYYKISVAVSYSYLLLLTITICILLTYLLLFKSKLYVYLSKYLTY